MTHELTRVTDLKTISYGDARAQIMLWQKALFLTPIWGIVVLPIFGFLIQCLSKGHDQVAFGLIVSVFLIYFINDLLKRKITFDSDYVYFGFQTMPIKDIVSIEVKYKKNKFLPTDLILNASSGKKMKFGLNCLTDKDVDILVKHLQVNNSKLETASVLASLVKCRRARVKPFETPQRLELPLNSRLALVQAVDTYKNSAGKWIRLGPIVAMGLAIPMWSSIVSGLFVSLQPHNWMHLQHLGSNLFFGQALSALWLLLASASGLAYTASRSVIENPFVLISELAFFAALVFTVQRLYFRANSLVADSKGITFYFRFGAVSVPLSKINWAKIARLNLWTSNGKTARIRFVKDNGKKLDLTVDSLTPDHRALLLKRVEKFAPTCQIEQDLAELMLPKANQSYTEIWLQSLNQSPERATLDPLSAGQLVGGERFSVVRKIGVGGQGTAYLCRDMHDKEEPLVVLKETIIPVFANNATTLRELEKFEREAKILQDLKHPGVVELKQYFVEDHRAYLVLEHVDGQSLSELVKHDGALSADRVIGLGLQMTEILAFLHGRGVVHRDFTPDNLLLNSHGRLKLIDFNVAQKGESGLTGTIVGKHAYLPPEQFRGKATTKSDIYAFGATLFFLLTGHDPEPISQSCPQEINNEISLVLNDIVKKATALKEENRFDSVDDLGLALAEVKHDG